MQMTTGQKLKAIAPLLVFNIVLNIVDIFTDLRLIVILYSERVEYEIVKLSVKAADEFDDLIACLLNFTVPYCTEKTTYYDHNIVYVSNPYWATALLVPFLLNYIITFSTWARLEKNKKWWSYIPPFLNIYAPYGEIHCKFFAVSKITTRISEAFKVVKTIWTKPMEGLEMKKVFERHVSLHEAFLESVPTALLTTAIIFNADTRKSDSFNILKTNLANIVEVIVLIIVLGKFFPFVFSETLARKLIGQTFTKSISNVLFTMTFLSSAFAASFGLTKSIKVGVANIIGQNGPCQGLMSGRFIITFFGKLIIDSQFQNYFL